MYFAACRVGGYGGICGSRTWRTFEKNGKRVTVVVTDINKPLTFSREECIEMLASIRRQEARSNWVCPEPPNIEVVVPVHQ